jgi:hypothetical protein
MGEQMPLPAGAAGESGLERLEDLDSQLDDALGDFDETMGESSAANSNGGAEQEIDILNPMTSGGSSSQNDEPLYDDGGPEGSGGQDGESGSIENEGIAQRAAQGADSGGQQGSASGSEGAESGSQSGGQQGSDSGSEGAESGSQSDGQQGSASASAGGASGASSADGQQAGSDSGAGSVIPVPEDVGDGRNDDIVLRQIREAALHEKDPVLRERLWEEYRRIRDQK